MNVLSHDQSVNEIPDQMVAWWWVDLGGIGVQTDYFCELMVVWFCKCVCVCVWRRIIVPVTAIRIRNHKSLKGSLRETVYKDLDEDAKDSVTFTT